MKRTTVLLPDDIAKLLKLEAERRGVTPSLVIREAVATYVAGPPTERRVLKFANIVSDDRPEVAAERLEEYLAEHYARDIRRDAFGED
ncbi:MAG: CopG family transcriptional regulator [Chloroflexota bacterium]